MLATWGVTCGLCRPQAGEPRSADRLRTTRRSLRPQTWAWLAVLSSPDAHQEGNVLPVLHHLTVLTREGAVTGAEGEIPFRDDFMSAGHARIDADGEGAEHRYRLADRQEPGPSANGTFLNQTRLNPGQEEILCDGDRIRVGSTELVFRSLLVPGGRA